MTLNPIINSLLDTDLYKFSGVRNLQKLQIC